MKVTLLFFCSLFCINLNGQEMTSHELLFSRNQGQIRDQYGNERKDIQYYIEGEGINIYIGNGQIHYQFNKLNAVPAKEPFKVFLAKDQKPGTHETYRIDVILEGANTQATAIAEDEQTYHQHYFKPGCPRSGWNASTYKKITFRNIYPNIDWVLQIKNGQLEQEFISQPQGVPAQIKLSYFGQTSLQLTKEGAIMAATPFGVIYEQAPICWLQQGDKRINSSYTLAGNTISYQLEKHSGGIVIDPTIEWATYYGPWNNYSPLYSVTSDSFGNTYSCGVCYSATDIATTGAFQNTYGGGTGDAYMVKFDSLGNRLWATYYGGSDLDWGYSVACDKSGNVYFAGLTSSLDTLVIATPGSHQPINGGGMNGFLAKFNSSGDRLWGTYYGGDQEDVIYSVVCDTGRYVYIAGCATSGFNIATPGSFESTYDDPSHQFVSGFLAQFDSAGTRHWGTYYKGYTGPGLAHVFGVTASSFGDNIYISGWSEGTDSIATPGTYQPVYAGGLSDVFVAKFKSSGARQWGTYYGGEAQDLTGSVACDRYGDVYILGATQSDTGIATTGCSQPLRGGGIDAFVAKLNATTGRRNWGTYFGGPGEENVDWSKMETHCFDHVYIIGRTNSDSGIAMPSALQPTYGGGDNDGFIAKYDTAGKLSWSTYYGGSGDDVVFACKVSKGSLYVCGRSNSPDGIATPGSYIDTNFGGPSSVKGFLAKIGAIDTIKVDTSHIDTSTAVQILRPSGTARVKLYPSPNAGTFTLEYSGEATDDEVNISVINSTGQQVFYMKTRSANQSLTVPIMLQPGLPKGNYLLEVHSRDWKKVVPFELL